MGEGGARGAVVAKGAVRVCVGGHARPATPLVDAVGGSARYPLIGSARASPAMYAMFKIKK